MLFLKKGLSDFFFLMVIAISLRGFVNNLNDSFFFFFRLPHNGRFFHKGFEHYTVR